ncbi:hypothetical protein HWV00_20890 (plasmid) [Moritella sp. 24]|uniref:hypothetical protein n=1 Tax=Moritella sp. 24 TaxID=2746230 RepID=UPI001BA48E98|nr:hypothetical protein [Moritella sp. 24]QUM78731.1 hypothetical protein HWV00_20890 [Moritella sp. 24]
MEVRADTAMKIIEAIQELVRKDEPNASASRTFDYAVVAMSAMAADIARQQPDPERQLEIFAQSMKGNAQILMRGNSTEKPN